jgi:serine/tyrosine/threonine adenylyltransferase
MNLNFSNTFTEQLPADSEPQNYIRQVRNACFSYATPVVPSNPYLIHASEEVASLIGIEQEELRSIEFLNMFSGASVHSDTKPYAMCYGGYQFGSWAGQLGDGRAINLGEVELNSKKWAIQLKGAGPTPYSRNADGMAVLRSSIREYLCSEAMFYLGIPTTRALSVIGTGDEVWRDVMYDGHPANEQGAVVCRVSESFIRFGSFEILAAQRDTENLKKLTDYVIEHFYPKIKSDGIAKYVAFFESIVNRTLDMVIHWQRVGFVHGVMNTDNMSILGLTIDYGPYGWLDGYDRDWTPNTTDRQNKRYRYGTQGEIALWNLVQLANALYPLIIDAKPLEHVLETYQSNFQKKYVEMMCSKLGLEEQIEGDLELIEDLEENLEMSETDMTIFFRNMACINSQSIIDEDFVINAKIKDAFYKIEEIDGAIKSMWNTWFEKYVNRLKLETVSNELRVEKMNLINPKFVLRNYMAQLAIDAADTGDFSVVSELYELLKNPYSDQSRNEKWFALRPEWARNKVGCSMLSCSS